MERLNLKIALFMFIAGIIIISLGLHEMDLSFNSKNSGCIDTNGFGVSKSPVEMHKQGMIQIPFGMFLMLISFIFIL